MLERIQVSLDVVEGENEELDGQINDKVNDAYGVIYALSNFVGPLAGSYIYEAVGGRVTSDYIALMNFVLFIVLFVFNCGPFVMQEHRVFIEKLNELKEKAEQLGEKVQDNNTSINDWNPSVLGRQKHSKSLVRPNVARLNNANSQSVKSNNLSAKKKHLLM